MFLLSGYILHLLYHNWSMNCLHSVSVFQVLLPIQTLEDLASSVGYTYGAMDGAALSTLFQVAMYSSHIINKRWSVITHVLLLMLKIVIRGKLD